MIIGEERANLEVCMNNLHEQDEEGDEASELNRHIFSIIEEATQVEFLISMRTDDDVSRPKKAAWTSNAALCGRNRNEI
jgi:hypothetical protein